MSHHNPRHPHRHHVQPKKEPISVAPPDNGYKGLFWLIVLGTAAVIGLGYCLSQPALPPAPSVPVIQDPPVPISAPEIREYAPALPKPDQGAPVIPAAEPVKPAKAEPQKHHKAEDDEPNRHKRHRHHHDD